MTRSIVFGALEVWSVPNTRWPVAAAVSASSIVSKIAHFTHEDDVRVLAQRAAQRRGERLRVDAHFAVVHETLLAAMHKFDRVLHGDDMVAPVEIGKIDHGRQRGGFAGTGRAGDKHHAFFQHRETLQNRRQAELLQREHLAGNEAEYRGDAVFLIQKIRAIPGEAGIFVTEIDVAGFLKDLDFLLGRNLVNQRLQVVVLQRRGINAHQFAVDAQHGLVARGEVKVGGILLLHELEIRIDSGHIAVINS